MPPRNGVIQKPRNTKGTLLRLGKYLLHSAPMLLLALTLSIAGNMFQLIGPTLCGRAIDALSGGKGLVDFATVFRYAAMMVVLDERDDGIMNMLSITPLVKWGITDQELYFHVLQEEQLHL